MQVICLEDSAFYTLVEQVVQRIKDTHEIKEDRWISGEEAMKKLRITSKTTLQELRDSGAIRFSQPRKKIILYDSQSIDDFLSKNAKNTF